MWCRILKWHKTYWRNTWKVIFKASIITFLLTSLFLYKHLGHSVRIALACNPSCSFLYMLVVPDSLVFWRFFFTCYQLLYFEPPLCLSFASYKWGKIILVLHIICQRIKWIIFCILNCCSVIVVYIFPSPLPPQHPSPPFTLNPTPTLSFFYVSFMHIPWQPFPLFPPLSPSSLSSGYCQFIL